MNSSRTRIERATYDLGGFLAEVGGLTKGLSLIFALTITFFGQFRMWALFANMLYKNDGNNDLVIQNYIGPSLRTGKVQKNKEMILKSIKGENTAIKAPKCVEFQTVCFACVPCFRSKKFNKYKKNTDGVKHEILKSLDVVKFI